MTPESNFSSWYEQTKKHHEEWMSRIYEGHKQKARWAETNSKTWNTLAIKKGWIEPLSSAPEELEDINYKLWKTKPWPLMRRSSREAWKDLRARLYHERGKSCGYCGDELDESYDLHHTTYNLGDNPQILRTVDKSCHSFLTLYGEEIGRKKILTTKLESKPEAIVDTVALPEEIENHTQKVNIVRHNMIREGSKISRDLKWLDYQSVEDHSIKDWVIGMGGFGRSSIDEWQLVLISDAFMNFVTELEQNYMKGGFLFNIDPFSEIDDLGTYAESRWRRKVVAYNAYHDSGRYQERYNTNGLRVLTITDNVEQTIVLKRLTDDYEGKRRFWFTTIDEVEKGSPLTSPIWLRAGEDGVFPLFVV